MAEEGGVEVDDEDEKEMVIDETPEPEAPVISVTNSHSSQTAEPHRIPFFFNNNQIKISTFAHRFSEGVNLW